MRFLTLYNHPSMEILQPNCKIYFDKAFYEQLFTFRVLLVTIFVFCIVNFHRGARHTDPYVHLFHQKKWAFSLPSTLSSF